MVMVGVTTFSNWFDFYISKQYFPPTFFFSSPRESQIQFAWGPLKGILSLIVTVVPVLIFKNSRCLILKARPEHSELKNLLPSPPPAAGLNHTAGKESLAHCIINSLLWFLSLLLPGTWGWGVVSWVGSQEIWYFSWLLKSRGNSVFFF